MRQGILRCHERMFANGWLRGYLWGMNVERQERGLTRLRDVGADLAGALVGAAIELAGGAPGAFGGAAAGVAVSHALRAVGADVDERALSPQQHERIGAVWILAGDEIRRRLEAGEVPRDDGFFGEGSDGQRPDAEELLEGVLLAAGDEYQQQKLLYLARLYSSLCFHSDVPAGLAHFLVRVADRLTFRQYGLISIFSGGRYSERFARADVARSEGGPRPEAGVLAELDQLGNQSVLGVGQLDGPPSHFASVYNGGSFGGLSLGKIAPMPVGERLFELMGLGDFPEEEIKALLLELGIRDGTGE